MAESITPGLQDNYAVDFLNAEGPDPAQDSSLMALQNNDNGSTDTEDPVSRGQAKTTALEQFVPRKVPTALRRVKLGTFPMDMVPNLTPGANRIRH